MTANGLSSRSDVKDSRIALFILQRHVEDMYVVGGNTGAEWLRSVDIFTVRLDRTVTSLRPDAICYSVLMSEVCHLRNCIAHLLGPPPRKSIHPQLR